MTTCYQHIQTRLTDLIAWCRSLTLKQCARFFISPLFASLIYFLCGLYANSVLQVVADRETINCGTDTVCPPAPDLGHEAFPYLTYWRICDYWLYGCVLATFIRFSPLFVSKSMWLVILRRWIFLQGTLFWMRGISVALTRQSVPQENCVSTATGNAWIEGFYIMSGLHITCGDIMYSGHTAAMTLCALIWSHYSKGEEFGVCCGERPPFITAGLDAVGDPATCSLTSICAWAIAFTGFFFIIATHFHYSNDVFIGCIITQFVFRVYHYYIKTVLELPGAWARIFRWFEGFDKSLLEHLLHHPQHKRGLMFGHPGYSSSPMPASIGGNGMVSPSPDGLLSEQDKREHHRTIEKIKKSPLTGVAVAVFSEGPTKKNLEERKLEPGHNVTGSPRPALTQGVPTGAGIPIVSSNKVTVVPQTFPVAVHLQQPSHPLPPTTNYLSPGAGLEDYDYHAMESGGGLVGPVFHSRSYSASSSTRSDSSPIIVAGEIAASKAEEKLARLSARYIAGEREDEERKQQMVEELTTEQRVRRALEAEEQATAPPVAPPAEDETTTTDTTPHSTSLKSLESPPPAEAPQRQPSPY